MDRAYVILDIMEGKHSEVIKNLRANPGVRWVDVLEGQWDAITAIEASNRKRLAELVIQALSSVESITEDMLLLPTCNVFSPKSRVEILGTVTPNKIKNTKMARCGRNRSNIPSSIIR